MARRAVQLLLLVRGGEGDAVAVRAEDEVVVGLAVRGEGINGALREIIEDHGVARKGIFLLLGGLDQQAAAVGRHLEVGHALERVDGAGGDFDHQQVLGLAVLDVLRGEQIRRGFVAERRLAGRADRLPRQRGQVDARDAVLGLLVFLLLVDLGLPHVGEGGLEREQADAGVLRPLQAGAAGDHRLRAGLEVLDIKRAVALLGIDLVAHEPAVGGQLDGADGLPSVIHAVVEGFLLGPGRAGAAQHKCDKRQDKRRFLHKMSVFGCARYKKRHGKPCKIDSVCYICERMYRTNKYWWWRLLQLPRVVRG